jgi:AcrR family transcriptional regulator
MTGRSRLDRTGRRSLMARKRTGHRSQWEDFCRKGIRDAVVRVLARSGPGGLTMERVASEAGLAKGTLYLYYKDKQHLLESVKEASLQPLRASLFGLLDGEAPPRRKLEDLVHGHLKYFDENREFFRVLLWERRLLEAHSKRHQSDPYRTYVEKIAAVIRQGIERGDFRPVDPVKVAAMLMEADIAVIGQRLWSETPGPVEDDARLLLDVFLNGIASRRSSLTRQP